MKLQRPGYTETDLLFCHYLKNIGIYDSIVKDTEENFVLWLYSTAGWYDNSLPYSGPKFFHKYKDRSEVSRVLLNSDVYKFWIDKYYHSVTNADFIIPLCHKSNFKDHYENHFHNFIDSLMPKNKVNTQFDNFWCVYRNIYPIIENKKLLVVSSFAKLIDDQYTSNNIYKIYSSFPQIQQLITYRFPYTFFNRGPDQNSIETLHKIYNDIKQYDFDVLLIGAGCYGCILTDMVNDLGKTGITIGHHISDFFGINPLKKNEYWIYNIPDEYIPEGYEHIDHGKYWKPTDAK